MTDFLTDRLAPTARGTPVATHTDQQDPPRRDTRRKRDPKPESSPENEAPLESDKDPLRKIDQLA